ncbi:MAG TPA: flagellar assembly protein FliW [Chthonomonadales bacterium]|nr:flagellar assembly protein FliW [Chthonomonadales bacterium]
MNTTCTDTLAIESTRFGRIEVDEELVVTLPGGLIGFEDCQRYVLVDHNDASPLRWLQSLDDPSLAFPVMDPWLFMPDYAPVISAGDAAYLELTEGTPRVVLAVLTIPRNNPRAMTANLLGPIVVNAVTRRGMQVVLTDDRYGTRHEVLSTLTTLASAVG